MVSTIYSVTFDGLQPRTIEIQAQLGNGLPAFTIVGLPDKAVSEARERVRAALHAMGLSLPPKRLIVNLAPADVLKEGSHFDLPIALAVLAAMEVIPQDSIQHTLAMGELSLNGQIRAVHGILPAAMHAHDNDLQLICPESGGVEASWIEGGTLLAPAHLLALINHLKGVQALPPVDTTRVPSGSSSRLLPDFAEVKGQPVAKRALEIAAAGGHHVLMCGPPGSGKSMLASRMPSILPEMSAMEALEASMIHSIAGTLTDGQIIRQRAYRDPHHSASQPALIGGGHRAKPGEISLAHHGVLFLDELPEFQRATLESLRQPLESGQAVIARANHHVRYPARFQLIAAMNPCRCGNTVTGQACKRGPRCTEDYQARLSGPLLDRFDLFVDVPAVTIEDLQRLPNGEPSAVIRDRVHTARQRQTQRHQDQFGASLINAHLQGEALNTVTALNDAGQSLMKQAAEKMNLSARGYYRVLRVARTIADLADSDTIDVPHLAEALSFRRRVDAA